MANILNKRLTSSVVCVRVDVYRATIREIEGNSRLDRIWNQNIYMPNQISYLASQHRQIQL